MIPRPVFQKYTACEMSIARIIWPLLEREEWFMPKSLLSTLEKAAATGKAVGSSTALAILNMTAADIPDLLAVASRPFVRLVFRRSRASGLAR